MSEPRLKASWAFPILDVGVAVLSLVWLIPISGALPAIAAPAFPFADTVWLTANLAGSLLFLAAGPRMFLSRVPSGWYVGGYTALLIVSGELNLWRSGGFRRLGVGWLLMALFVGVMLLLLRRFWLWALVGGLWSGLVLGVWSYGGIVGFLSDSSGFPAFLPLPMVGCVADTVVGLLHLRFRRPAPGDRDDWKAPGTRTTG
jgi:hypothetical protein